MSFLECTYDCEGPQKMVYMWYTSGKHGEYMEGTCGIYMENTWEKYGDTWGKHMGYMGKA